jgi:hypothetical protein
MLDTCGGATRIISIAGDMVTVLPLTEAVRNRLAGFSREVA